MELADFFFLFSYAEILQDSGLGLEMAHWPGPVFGVRWICPQFPDPRSGSTGLCPARPRQVLRQHR